MKKLLSGMLIVVLLNACTWVELTPAGKKVRVLSESEVTGCKKLGKTHAMLKDKIAGFQRDSEKVKEEMETLARNSAAEMQGDTVVPASEIKDGEQVFDVYRCVNPGG